MEYLTLQVSRSELRSKEFREYYRVDTKADGFCRCERGQLRSRQFVGFPLSRVTYRRSEILFELASVFCFSSCITYSGTECTRRFRERERNPVVQKSLRPSLPFLALRSSNNHRFASAHVANNGWRQQSTIEMFISNRSQWDDDNYSNGGQMRTEFIERALRSVDSWLARCQRN